MTPELPSVENGGLLYAVGASLVALGLGARYMITNWKQGAADAQRADAEGEVLSNLRDEVRRLSDQNDKLASRLNDMQDQAVDLSGQIMNLRIENNQLRHEIASLNTHNQRLQEEIVRLHGEITRLQGINGDDRK